MKARDSLLMRASGALPRFRRPVWTVAAVIAGAAALAACQSANTGVSADPAAAVAANAQAGKSFLGLGGGAPNKGVIVVDSGATPSNSLVRPDGTYDPAIFARTGYCPVVQVRAGTESYRSFEKKHEDDPAFVRFQGSIDQTARECQPGPDGKLVIKLGVAGRIIGGPKAAAGPVALPLRVAVVRQHDSAVLFTQAFKAQSTLAAPDFSGSFSQVVDNIAVAVAPTDRDLIVYVGFDDGGPAPKVTKPVPTG